MKSHDKWTKHAAHTSDRGAFGLRFRHIAPNWKRRILYLPHQNPTPKFAICIKTDDADLLTPNSDYDFAGAKKVGDLPSDITQQLLKAYVQYCHDYRQKHGILGHIYDPEVKKLWSHLDEK